MEKKLLILTVFEALRSFSGKKLVIIDLISMVNYKKIYIN